MTDWGGRSFSFTYDPDGNLAGTNYPNADAVSATYDLGDATTDIDAYTGTTSLVNFAYGVNDAEQVQSETDSGAETTSSAYTYANADRLGSVTVGSGSAADEAYDGDGDPTTLPNGNTQSFNTDDQLTGATTPSSASESYTYNATGDRTGSSGTATGPATYGYDQLDELTSASVGSSSATYAYNYLGLLTGRTTGGTTATFDWGTAGSLALLLSDGANDYLYGPDGTPIEQEGISSGTSQYYVSDDQGSTRALLSSSGSVDATYVYDAYGNLTSSSGTASTPLLYDGQYQDPVSGLYYLRARWYDPETAELLSVDPDVAQTNEAYEYAGDDPVNMGDPSGDEWEPNGGVASTEEVDSTEDSADIHGASNGSVMTAMNYFVARLSNKGVDPPREAAGVVGVLIQESALIPPCVENVNYSGCTIANASNAFVPSCPRDPQGRGIAQWSWYGDTWGSCPGWQDRYNGLLTFAANNGVRPADPFKHMEASWESVADSLTIQLEYVWYEFHTVPTYDLSGLEACTTVSCSAATGAIYEGTSSDVAPGTTYGSEAFMLYAKEH